ncbi:phospholipase [Wenzhouxiangella sp. XN79A]|uniref:phospholipase D-like domain-containing protein n=1 Tax=Wenzhouxiangella sp. XN79A TaxID=2724193 RepID=UPI00144A6D0A|nr:phospholipase D-like domain-containing protein [Wenzhouxiangella sp. XN79A]NKI34991.1 phospholipase [Wenzhouxiangella sp. XN79A]
MNEIATAHPNRRARGRRALRLALLALLVAWIGTATVHRYKPLPPGISVAMPARSAEAVVFLADLTWIDERGARRLDHRIFERALARIGQARRLVVLDMFLFNDFAGSADGDGMRPLSDQLEQALVARKRAVPGLRAVLITDPINGLYGGVESDRLDRLRAAGIDVVVTALPRLRDSNPAWSGLWRLCCRWAGNDDDGGWLPNPVGPGEVTLRTWLRLVNFKANHRKTLVVDSPEGWIGLVTSANPHDASSAHGNVALEFRGPAALDLLATEAAVAAFSGAPLDGLPAPPPARPVNGAVLQVLTESAIRDAAIDAIDAAGLGDRVDLAIFYLSHRGVIVALKRAAARGATVRVLMDPNRDAFGAEKDGIPNRPVGRELVDAGVTVRWCATSGEQCHSKSLQVIRADGSSEWIGGSANFTRRNLDDLNLETNARLAGPAGHPALSEAAAWFEQRWSNRAGRLHSLPYDEFAEDSRLRYWRYRVMEFTGLSTF